MSVDELVDVLGIRGELEKGKRCVGICTASHEAIRSHIIHSKFSVQVL